MDPTVEEAIQRLKEGNASPEDARIAFESGYQGGPKTQEYYRQLGLLDSPQDTPPVNNRALTPEEQYAMAQADAKVHGTPTYDPELVAQNQANRAKDLNTQLNQAEATSQAQPRDTSIQDAISRGMQAWSPLAPGMIKGGDRSGEAAGYRAGAAIQDKAAADNAKILQWNKQRAMDNTLADKVAAAQAQGKWKQNANALGAEGGASVVASQNEAVTPDIMAQKQYQSQQMNTATQNLAEVNARKVAAQNNRTKADMTDYNTQYNESKDAYVTNLATANGQTDKQEDKKEEPKQETTKPEATEKPDGKVEDNTQNNEPQAAAEVNQQSQATETATQEVSEQQQLQDLADEINGIHNAVESMKHNSQTNSEALRKQKARYDEIKPLYDELAAKSKNPPPQASVPDFGMFDDELSEVPETILTGVNQRFLN